MEKPDTKRDGIRSNCSRHKADRAGEIRSVRPVLVQPQQLVSAGNTGASVELCARAGVVVGRGNSDVFRRGNKCIGASKKRRQRKRKERLIMRSRAEMRGAFSDQGRGNRVRRRWCLGRGRDWGRAACIRD